jgi:hypothetical protein
MRKCMMRVSIACVLAAGAACAQAGGGILEGDVYINIEGGSLTTGLISEDGSTITPGVRVFFAEFGLDVPNVTDEPGFQSAAGGLGSSTTFTFNIRQALRRWDGVNFATIAAEQVEAELGPVSVMSPATDVLTPGITIPVDAGGSHEHPDWTLQAPASNGVYLLELEFVVGAGGGGGGLTSQPIWILWAQNTETVTNEAAYAWAVTNIPSPGVVGGALVVGVAGLARARRRRA